MYLKRAGPVYTGLGFVGSVFMGAGGPQTYVSQWAFVSFLWSKVYVTFCYLARIDTDRSLIALKKH